MMEFPIIDQESDEERLLRMARFIGIEEMFPPRRLHWGNVQEKMIEAKTRFVDLHIQTICDEYSELTRIEISPTARELIRLIHRAILADSHSAWTGNPIQVVDQYLANLNSTLAEIARDEQVQDKMTTFDVLHWISKGRDLARLCIIEKDVR